MVRIHNPHKSSEVLEMNFLLIGDTIVEGTINMIPKLWAQIGTPIWLNLGGRTQDLRTKQKNGEWNATED